VNIARHRNVLVAGSVVLLRVSAQAQRLTAMPYKAGMGLRA
jgi:hypothetical protein